MECPAHKVHLVCGAVGEAAPGVYAVVRGVGDGDGPGDAGGEARGSGRGLDRRIWRIVHHYVDLAVDAQNLESVDRAGIDETSSRRGQNYVSVFADLDERRGVFVVENRDYATMQAFSLVLEAHGAIPDAAAISPMIRPFAAAMPLQTSARGRARPGHAGPSFTDST